MAIINSKIADDMKFWVLLLVFCLGCKTGLISESQVRQQSYCDYEKAIYDAIFDSYERFATIDDFIYFALTNIAINGIEPNTNYKYNVVSKEGSADDK